MEYRSLGNTGTTVSSICLGTMQFLWTADEAASYAVLDAYVEAGGNFIDTADVYTRQGAGVGSVELLLGRWLADRGVRDDLVIATKVRARMWDGPNGEGLSRRHIMRAVEGSLRRLGTEHIDLYQAHWADPDTPTEETMRAFDELVRAGKVRYVGASNYSNPWRLGEAMLVAEYEHLSSFVTYQAHYSLLFREEVERWLLPAVQRHNLGLLAWSPLEGGVLTGKYRRGQPLPRTPRAAKSAEILTEQAFNVIEALIGAAKAAGCTPAQLALSWILQRPSMSAAIIGANDPDQLMELLAAADLDIGDDARAELDAISMWHKPDWWLTGL